MPNRKALTLKDRPGVKVFKDNDLAQLINSPNNRERDCPPKLKVCLRKVGWYEDQHFMYSDNEEGESKLVDDGWQRVRVAQTLNLPIYGMLSYPGFRNHGRPGHDFSGEDSLSVYKKQKVKDYLTLQSLLKATDVSVTVMTLACVLEGHLMVTADTKTRFHDGHFRIKDLKRTRELLKAVHQLEGSKMVWATDGDFVEALASCRLVPNFDLAVAVNQFGIYRMRNPRTFKAFMSARRSVQDYLRLIDEVYNHNNGKGRIVNLSELASEIRNT